MPAPQHIDLDPLHLQPLPFVKTMVRWSKDSNEFIGFKEDIKANGIKHRILITPDHKVVDGWTRVLAAQDWKFDHVPCEIVPPEEVNEIIIRELVRRRNLTKGQLAYVSQPLWQATFTSSFDRRVSNLKKGQASAIPAAGASVQEWCAQLGFSRDLFEQAQWLRKTFTQHPELVAEWEPKLLAPDPISLGAAKAGISYLLTAAHKRGGRPEDQNRQLSLFTQASTTDLLNRWEYWAAFDDDTRQEHWGRVRQEAAALPPDRCTEVADYYLRLAKEFRNAAKKGAHDE